MLSVEASRGDAWASQRPAARSPGVKENQTVEPWTVQLLTIVGVAVGAFASFISTRLVDRSRWHREEALRWDTKKLSCYSAFAAAIKRHIGISDRLCAGAGLPAGAQPLDSATGLPALADAEEDLSVKWEKVLMLGSPDAVAAARDWRHAAWQLEWLARGLREGTAEYTQANLNAGSARKRFYGVARAELGVVSGDLPELGQPPTWQTPEKNQSILDQRGVPSEGE
jgi:hypothetical protein